MEKKDSMLCCVRVSNGGQSDIMAVVFDLYDPAKEYGWQPGGLCLLVGVYSLFTPLGPDSYS